MSTPIQNLNSIAPAEAAADNDKELSQAATDYEEGRGYVERGEAALAAVSLHNALLGFEEEKNQEGIANASNQLGHACLIREEYDKALIHYQRAWDICEALDDQTSLLALAKQLVQVQKGLKEYRKAIDLCLYLLDNYQRNNDPQGTVDSLELMAGVYVASGEPEKAADAYTTVASIHANFKHDSIAESFRQKAAALKKEAK
jgi:tetratricopeptide (TPR) repeat protein